MALRPSDHLVRLVQRLSSHSSPHNPDVWKAYKDTARTELLDLDNADGWIELINVADSNPDSVIVINTAARNNKSVSAYGQILSNTLPELRRKLVTLWVINRQRDSLELLKEYMDAIPDTVVHVVRNGYFGEELKFELYNGQTACVSRRTRTRRPFTNLPRSSRQGQ
jgi:hypothetical protein